MLYTSPPIRLNKISDGQTQYLHIKYSNNGGLTFTENNGETVGDYIGLYADFNKSDPLDVSLYKWSLFRGKDGAPGEPGENGTSVTILGSYDSEAELNAAHPTGDLGDAYIVNGDLYVWNGSKWENVGTIQGPAGADGVGVQSTSCAYQVSSSGTNIPTGTWLTYIPSVPLGQYLWTRTVIWYTNGTSSTSYSVGYKGTNGTNGNTSYLHIKYSDDGETFTDNNGNTLGAWIGTLVDFNEAASNNFSDYTWKKFTEDVDDEIENLAGSIQIIRESVGQLTVEDTLIRSSVSDLVGLVHVNTGEIQQTREQISSINQTAEEIELKVETINNDGVTKIRNTTGTFNEDGLEINSTESTTKTQITPDGMTVYQKRYGSTVEMLTANSAGVDATNLHAKTYLIIGGRTRFEKYGNDRVGCYWIGGN